MTTLTNPVPIVLELRTGTNTGVDFARLVWWYIRRGHLVRHDFLVIDGARVHFSENVRQWLEDRMNAAGVFISYLVHCLTRLT
jgi:hypothetical protein